MPSANRFALLRETVRNHPVVVASGAASAGVLLGGFVAFQLLAPPPRVDSAAATPAAISIKGEAKPAPETTGSAPAGERTASADCEKETWPHLSPRCVEEMRNKNRVRVISTDKLDKPAVTANEATPPAAPESKPAAPVIANTAPVASPSSASPPVDLAAAPSAVFAAPDPSPAAVATPEPTPSQPAADAESKKEKRLATKSKRKPKAEPKTIPAKQESDDDDDTPSTTASVASSDPDDRVSERRADRRVDRRRIVERWTERDYDVPASSGDGTRRITVIRRGGGGLFESLFGN